MKQYRVYWWVRGTGAKRQGSDVVKAKNRFEEYNAETLIEDDLSNVRENEPGCWTPNCPNFLEAHHEVSCASKHSEVSNWGVRKVVPL
jgi:hypothetical protein